MAKQQRDKQAGVPLDRLRDKIESQEIRLHGAISKGKRPSRFEQDPYNEYQNFLYNRALFGLGVYPKEEVAVMHWDKKKRIIKVHKRAQTLINIWKQEIINVLSNHLFTTIFPGTPITKELTEKFGNATDELHVNKMPFRSLNITKVQVVEKFMSVGILPKNFNELVPKETSLHSRLANVRHKESKKKELKSTL